MLAMVGRDGLIGAAVLQLRAGRPQQAVADEMRAKGHKWSQSTVWAVEKGERRLTLAEADDLAEVLEVPVTDFLKPPTDLGYTKDILDECRSIRRLFGDAVWAMMELAASRDLLIGLMEEASRATGWSVATDTEIRLALTRTPEQALEEARMFASLDDGPTSRTEYDELSRASEDEEVTPYDGDSPASKAQLKKIEENFRRLGIAHHEQDSYMDQLLAAVRRGVDLSAAVEAVHAKMGKPSPFQSGERRFLISDNAARTLGMTPYGIDDYRDEGRSLAGIPFKPILEWFESLPDGDQRKFLGWLDGKVSDDWVAEVRERHPLPPEIASVPARQHEPSPTGPEPERMTPSLEAFFAQPSDDEDGD